MAKELTTLQQIKKLDEERAQLLETAKADALTKAEEAINELTALGFGYELVETHLATKKPRRAKSAVLDKSERHAPKGECPICQFTTEPPHDRRSHRMQNKKKPFTDPELEQKSMKRANARHGLL